MDLAGLSRRLDLRSVRVQAADAGAWECGGNPDRLANAELAWDLKDSSRASLFFSPASDLQGRALKIEVRYANGRHQELEITGGTTHPHQSVPPPHDVSLDSELSRSLSLKWLGQQEAGEAGRGGIHLQLSGLPANATLEAAALSDSYGGYWVFCRPEAEDTFYIAAAPTALQTLVNPPEHEQFGLVRLAPYAPIGGSAATRFSPLPFWIKSHQAGIADIWLAPFRNELDTLLTLRVVLRNERGEWKTAACHLRGQACDPFARGPLPAETSGTVRPGDDLNLAVNRYGRVILSSGLYRIAEPLVLAHPVVIEGTREAILEFAQTQSSPPWSEAVRISAPNVTLRGFTVRFAGPVRWRGRGGEVGLLRAVPGGLDASGQREPIVNLTIQGLDLAAAPVVPLPEPDRAQESVFTMQFGAATSGRILNNVIRGGTTDVMNGPWEMSGNLYLGSMPGTFAWDAFAAHYVHDLTVARNRLAPAPPCGKTWRFLVLTQRGERIAVVDNQVENIGMKDDDRLPNPNAPEIFLTESYRLNFEGRPARILADGWIVQIPLVLDWQVEPGCILSILSGPGCGRSFRIAQPLSPTAFLLEEPLPEVLRAGDEAVSIAHGFSDLSFERNTIDARGGRSALVVLAGNHWNTRLVGNLLLGGGEAMRLASEATERPGRWGWSRTPLFDLLVSSNLCEEARSGIAIDVSGDPHAKTIAGRTYLTGLLTGNTVQWSDKFLKSLHAAKPSFRPRPFPIGARSGPDPRQMRLRVSGNTVVAPPGVEVERSVSRRESKAAAASDCVARTPYRAWFSQSVWSAGTKPGVVTALDSAAVGHGRGVAVVVPHHARVGMVRIASLSKTLH